MATCKNDCLHHPVCRLPFNTSKTQVTFAQVCHHFKNKADFVEVKHGRKIVHKRHRGFHLIDCPLCNGSFQSNEPYSEDVEYCSECEKKLDDTFQNYCPNCGAKMDGERKKDNG